MTKIPITCAAAAAVTPGAAGLLNGVREGASDEWRPIAEASAARDGQREPAGETASNTHLDDAHALHLLFQDFALVLFLCSAHGTLRSRNGW